MFDCCLSKYLLIFVIFEPREIDKFVVFFFGIEPGKSTGQTRRSKLEPRTRSPASTAEAAAAKAAAAKAAAAASKQTQHRKNIW